MSREQREQMRAKKAAKKVSAGRRVEQEKAARKQAAPVKTPSAPTRTRNYYFGGESGYDRGYERGYNRGYDRGFDRGYYDTPAPAVEVFPLSETDRAFRDGLSAGRFEALTVAGLSFTIYRSMSARDDD